MMRILLLILLLFVFSGCKDPETMLTPADREAAEEKGKAAGQ